jgi:hypothetical protein
MKRHVGKDGDARAIEFLRNPYKFLEILPTMGPSL